MEFDLADKTGFSPIIKTIVKTPPSWTVRYGTFAFVGFLLILFCLSNLIAYNDVVEGRVLVTTSDPIVTLKSRKAGEISRLLIKSGDSIKEGQILAVLKTTGSLEDIQTAKEILTAISEGKGGSLADVQRYYPSNLRLGKLQDNYLEFFLKYNAFLVNDSLTPFATRNQNLEKQMSGQKNLLNSIKRQLSLLNSRSEISANDMLRSKRLLEKGVISQKEFEETFKAHLDLLEQKELLAGEVYEKQIQLDRTGDATANSRLTQLTFLSSNDQIFRQAYQGLRNAIEDWETENLIKSPINGIANGHNIWEVYRNVEAGEVLFSIVPHNASSGLGIIDVPVERFSKIQKGQEVVIKLSSFPYQQYGNLNGRVSGMSSIPDQNKQIYSVFVDIPSFTTSYATHIKIEQQMVGRAQIVTEKLSLAQRIFYKARKILNLND